MEKSMLKKFLKRKMKFFIAIIISFLISIFLTSTLKFFKKTNLEILIKTMEANVESLHYYLASFFSGNLSSVRERKGIYNNIFIIAIDDKAIEKYGKWPFDRKVWSDFLEYLNKEKNPPLVFFDIIFGEKSASPKSDEALINSFKNYKGKLAEDIIFETFKTTVGKEIEKEEESFLIKKIITEGDNYFSPKIQAIKKFELNLKEKPRLSSFAKCIPMMEELAKRIDIAGSANVNLEILPISKIPLVVSCYYYFEDKEAYYLTNIYYPSIVLSMAASLLDSKIEDIEITTNKLTIKNAQFEGKRIDFEIPVDDQLNLKINYKSLPSSGYVKIIPFSKYQQYKFQSNDILFLGMYSTKGAYDIKNTPFGEMYGIELNAYAFGTIINRDFIKENSNFLFNFLYTFIISSATGILVCFGTLFAIIALFIALILPVLTGFVSFINGTSIITFIPMVTSAIVLVIMQVYMLLTEEKEKSWIKSTFSSYLNPKLVDILLQNPEMIRLGGEERRVTVLFSSIKNLGDFSQRFSPEEMVEFLNSYFSKMAEIVINNDGTLDKYIADNVMAFWGAPVEVKDQAFKACEASIKMKEAVEELNKELKEKGLAEIAINIGINTGTVVVGNVGSEKQTNYTVMGDTVNLASRIKGLNKYFHTNIIISETTYEEVKDRFYFRELDLTRVKGKTKPVRIYEILDLK